MEFLFGLGGLFLLGGLFIAIPLFFRKVVPTNEVHIVQTGKATVSYGKDTGKGNVYYKIPSWVPHFGVEVNILPVSIFNVELADYDAYDKGRLPFMVDVVAFFRVADYAQAANRVSSISELHGQLLSIVQGAVRSILAKSEIESIMEERSKFGTLFTEEVKEQLKSWGVETVKNIELMDVRDANGSTVIQNVMAKKRSQIEMESRQEVAKNKKVAEMAEIDAKREVDLQRQSALQLTGLRQVEAEKAVELAKAEKQQTLNDQARLTKEKEMEVIRVTEKTQAEIAQQVAIVQAEQMKTTALIGATREKETALIKATQEKEVGITKAEQEFFMKTKAAEAALEVSKNTAAGNLELSSKEAEGLRLTGLAKAETEKAMLMAPVDTQITLAKEIGENQSYQEYLISIRKVEAGEAVGTAQAAALQKAQIKIIANTGDASSGLNSVTDVFTSKGGSQLGAMIEGFAATEAGKAVLDTVGIKTQQ